MRSLTHGIIAALLLAALPIASQAGVFVGVSVNIAPPVLPVYVQPPCPAAGYIWIPGYWAWAAQDVDAVLRLFAEDPELVSAPRSAGRAGTGVPSRYVSSCGNSCRPGSGWT